MPYREPHSRPVFRNYCLRRPELSGVDVDFLPLGRDLVLSLRQHFPKGNYYYCTNLFAPPVNKSESFVLCQRANFFAVIDIDYYNYYICFVGDHTWWCSAVTPGPTRTQELLVAVLRAPSGMSDARPCTTVLAPVVCIN